MKIWKIAALALASLLLLAGTSRPASAGVSFDFFYSNLSPHGSWLVSGSYGQVWQPSVYTGGWNPYYDGHWVYTDCGWTWVSDYDWGAVPYHYGTWVLDPALGWVWVPGYVWGPSWVVFRTGPDYVGWAPVSPDFSVGVSFGSSNVDASFFVFVPTREFLAPRVRTYVVPRTEITRIVNRTTIVNNITVVNNVVVNHGPDVRQIEKVSGRRIERVPIERVKNLSPRGTPVREAIRVDPQRMRKGLKVTEPVKTAPERTQAREKRKEGGAAGAAPSAGQRQEPPESGEARGRGRNPKARPPHERPGQATAPPGETNEPGAAPPTDERGRSGKKQRPEPPGVEPANPRAPRARPRPQRPEEPPVAGEPGTGGGARGREPREPKVSGEAPPAGPPSAQGERGSERAPSARGKPRQKPPSKGKPEEKKKPEPQG